MIPPQLRSDPGNRWMQGGIAALLLVLTVAAGLYLTGAGFQEKVRLRVIAELELVTGGRVEIKTFRWDLRHLSFEAFDLTIHGLEAPDDVPYAHIDDLMVRLKVLSLFRQEVGLREVVAGHATIHIIVYPDGTTNQPVPRIKQLGNRTVTERLFDLAIDRLQVNDSELLWNNRRMALDFTVNKVLAEMTYDALQKQFNGIVTVADLHTRLADKTFLPASAEVRFVLAANHVTVQSFTWHSGKSNLAGTGSITDLRDPRGEFNYKGSFYVSDFAAMLRRPQVRNGILGVDGKATVSANLFTSTGKLDLKDLQWIDQNAKLAVSSSTADYSVDRDKLVVDNLVLEALGGSVTGRAEILNWLNSPYQAPQPKPSAQAVHGNVAPSQPVMVKAGPVRGSADLRLNALQLSSLVAAAPAMMTSIERVHPAGSVSGSLLASWIGSPLNADTRVNLHIVPPAHAPAGHMPVAGEIQAVYHSGSGVADVSQLHLSSPTTNLQASGILGRENSRMHVLFSASSLREVGPLLSASLAAQRIPIELQGRASFDGYLSGRLASPQIQGHVDLGPFDSFVKVASSTAPGASAEAPRRVHWDSAVADITYAGGTIATKAAVFRRGQTELTAAGRVRLRGGAIDPGSPLELHAKVANASLADLESIVGAQLPVTGTLNLALDVTGSLRDSHGQGTLKITDATLYGEPVKQISAAIRLAGSETDFDNIVISHAAGNITGSGGFNQVNRAIRLQLQGNDFDLARVTLLKNKKIDMQGVASFHVRASGTTAQPIIDGDARFTKLVANGEPAGDVIAQAVTHGSTMHLTATSQLKQAQLALNGDVEMRGDFPAQLAATFSNLDIDPLIKSVIPGDLEGHNIVAGSATVQGPLRYWRKLSGAAEISKFSGNIKGVMLTNSGPVRFTVANQVIAIDQLHLVGEDTDISAKGTVQLAGERLVNVRADGKVNLKLLQTLNPELIASGSSTIGVTVGGSLAKVALTGQIQVVGRVQFNSARLALVNIPNTLSDIKGSLVFNEDRLQMSSLSAKTGGGTISLGGFVAYQKGVLFDVTGTIRGVRMRYPPGISATADADLRWNGTPAASLLSGGVTVVKFGVTPRFDFGQYLARGKVGPSSANSGSPVDNMRLDVQVTSTPELNVETSLAKLSGDADIHLRGSVARPSVLGRINIVEGEVFISGTRYRLDRGDITFNNPVRIEPVINLEASARVREYDLTIGFHGSTDKLSTTYRSDPPLPPSDVIALLALGRTRDESTIQQVPAQNFGDPVSNALLGETGSASVSNRSQKLFGLSRIKIDPQVGGPENNPNARITLEQQISNNVTLTYITNLSQSAQQILQVEFNINRKVSVVAVRDQNGVLGFDLRVRTRKK